MEVVAQTKNNRDISPAIAGFLVFLNIGNTLLKFLPLFADWQTFLKARLYIYPTACSSESSSLPRNVRENKPLKLRIRNRI